MEYTEPDEYTVITLDHLKKGAVIGCYSKGSRHSPCSQIFKIVELTIHYYISNDGEAESHHCTLVENFAPETDEGERFRESWSLERLVWRLSHFDCKLLQYKEPSIQGREAHSFEYFFGGVS